MSRRRFPLFALSLAALPMAAQAQEEGISGARILACEADRTAEGCATLLSKLFVCDQAEEMTGCADLLALREAAVDLNEREAALNGEEAGEEGDDEAGIVEEPEEDENIEVEVRAEGELVDELEDEALTEGEERLREEDEEDENGADGDASEDEAGTEAGGADAEGADAEGAGTEGAETEGADEAGAEEDGAEAAQPEGADATDTASGENATDDAAATDDTAEAGAVVGEENACPVAALDDWAAWVSAMPGPDGPKLIVTGTVTMPSPGYSVTLEQGISDRSAQPVQVVQLVYEAPQMDAPQVLSDYDLRFEMASPAPVDGTQSPFRGVRVVCGEQEIILIEPVEVAQ